MVGVLDLALDLLMVGMVIRIGDITVTIGDLHTTDLLTIIDHRITDLQITVETDLIDQNLLTQYTKIEME